MKFVPFNPPQDKGKKNISKGTYTENPPWHQVQSKVQGFSRFPPGFTGSLSASSILTAARSLATYSVTGIPTAAGTLEISGNSLGSFDWVSKNTTTISSFSSADWFTSTQDTRSAWIVIKGNLTINSGQTFIPPVRKLFTVIYITGNLTLNGTISMTARGANHSGTGTSGGFTAPVAIRIGTGTFGAVTNPQIPATGGSGGQTTGPTVGKNDGGAGTNGATGGGGSGYSFSSGTAGSGSAGTCFTGGTGGGGTSGTGTPVATDGEANGGKGGNAANTGASNGGTGNPGGNAGAAPFSETGNSGTGGTLIVIVEGSFTGSGSCISNGTDARRLDSGRVPGGASGAGSVTVLFGTNPSGGTVTANGGSGNSGGNGGNGTARKLAIGSN